MSNTTETAHSNAGESFGPLGLTPPLTDALDRLDLDAPTDIQKALIPAILDGKDCLACATTGVGKTNVYLLPILQRTQSSTGLHALIIQPTRSLAMRLQRNIRRFAPECEPEIALALGGRDSRGHDNPFDNDPDLIIATPRGAADLVRLDGFDWTELPLLVIDEFDAIIDDRGARHLERVDEAMGEDTQTILITGHFEGDLREQAEEYLCEPVEFEAEPPPPRALSAQQTYIKAEAKFDTLLAWCKRETPKLALLFTTDEERGRELVGQLSRARISCRWETDRRQRGPRGDRGGRKPRQQAELIIAADPASSRLSTIPATHLVHYDLPEDVDTYMHRLETAARLRKNGCAVALVEPDEMKMLPEIEERTGVKLTEITIDLDAAPPPRANQQSSSRRESEKSPTPAPAPAPAPRKAPTEDRRGRLNQLLYPNAELEARGVKPPRRTLGARFCAARRNKPLRRPN
ncbi:DEAD/DEAH box helicase [uncultured Ilyobacter sp.]|uniref:DEAD/DEAH box helicase n=1 Tax=uncultured Ilyobacter sp. TaxID=544433 RepID=UPI0029F52F0A|nr:DEAD/DEAH box helicase [uncultured Ilyobacter sp.]